MKAFFTSEKLNTLNPSNFTKTLLLAFMLLGGASVWGQTTYTWIGGNGAWNVPANWSSVPGGNPRTTPNVGDVLLFNDGGTYTVNTVPLAGNQTIAKLLVTNNSNITLQGSGNRTVIVNGPATETNFLIEAGSTFSNIPTSNMVSITVNAGQVAEVAGTLNWLGGTFTASGSTFNVSGTINQTAGTITSGAVVGTVVNHFGTWNMNSGATTLLGGNVTGTFNLISGTLTMNNSTYPSTFTATSVFNHTGGTVSNTVPAAINFAANATYNHLATTAVVAIPVATWDVDSDIFITGITTATSYGFPIATSTTAAGNQAFGNVTINCPNQTGVTSINPNASTSGTYYYQINGDFTIVSLGSGSLRVKGNTYGTHLTVNGLFKVEGGNVFGTQSTSNTCTILANGGYHQTGGTMNLSSIGLACNMTVGGNFLLDNGTFTQTGTAPSTITFNNGLGGTYTINGGTMTNTYMTYALVSPGILTLNNQIVLGNGTIAGRTFSIGNGATLNLGAGISSFGTTANTGVQIASGGTLNCGTGLVTGTGLFGLAPGAIISIGSQDGITTSGATGNIQSSGARTYNAGAHYIYSGTNGQVTGSGLPSASTTGVTGSITVNLSDGGNLELTSALMTISSAGVLRMVNGGLSNAARYANTNTCTLEYAGIAAQTTTDNEWPGVTNSPNTVIINNPNGVTMHASRTIGVSTSGTLNMLQGILNTSGSTLVTVSGTLPASIIGGSTTSYVNGPLGWDRTGVNSSYVFNFPIGKSVYAPFSYTNGTSGQTTYVVEYFETAPTAAAGLGLSAVGDTYWRMQRTSGSVDVLTSTVTLTESGIVADSRIGHSPDNSATAFVNIGGTGPASSISSIPVTIGADNYYTIGTGGTLSGTQTAYTTLTSIANALQTMQVTGNTVFELPTSYSGEPAYPVVFNPFTEDGSGPYTVIIRPAAGSTNFLTAGVPVGANVPLINLNGMDRLTIDGRAGGAGSSVWTFRNTQTTSAGPTFQFVNDATYNTLSYLTVEGQNVATSSTAGTILFGLAPSPLTLGNSNNTISYCHIKGRADNSATPAIGIYSVGTSGITNNNNHIHHNEIYDYHGSATVQSGIFVSSNSSAWTIEDNHFYQTASRVNGTGSHYVININNTGSSFIVRNNFIGGSQSSAGGSAYTLTGTSGGTFNGIYFNPNTNATGCEIENNVIRNISFSRGTSVSAVAFIGIRNANGHTNIDNNTIGATTGTGSIMLTDAFSTSGQNNISNGIVVDLGNTAVRNNIIGSITTAGASAAVAHSFYGILIASGIDTLENNIIGSETTANSINASNASTNSIGQFVVGIQHNSTSTGNHAITGNKVVNLNNAVTAAAGNARGIATSTGTTGNLTISDNDIYNIAVSSANTGTGVSASNIGILMQRTAAGQIVSGNTIYGLSNNTASAVVHVSGIHFSGPTTGTNAVSGNFIHSLSLTSSNVGGSIIGINALAGLASYHNNMIRLGIDASGAAITTGYSIQGISLASTTASNRFIYNTVYVGGASVVGSSNTYAFNKSSAAGLVDIRNNIFVNNRSNASGSSVNVALGFTATHSGANLVNLNNNLYNFSGTGGRVAEMPSGTNFSTIVAWQTASTVDAQSLAGAAGFINATGNAASVNLHINPATPTQVESGGIAITGFDTDYDNNIRQGSVGYSGASTTGPDIGADEGDFTPTDATPPLIVYTLIPTQTSFTAPTLAATITDANAVNVASGFAPRIYYKRSTDANTYNDNTSGTDGWKYVESPTGSSPFSLQPNYALLNGGAGVSAGMTIQYFVVAQDTSSNVAINSGTFAAAPSSVQLTSAAFPLGATINSYYINVLNGTYTVGTGGNFTSLTNAGGLFETINTGSLSGNVIAEITTDLTAELGTHALNQWIEIGGSGYTLTIRPSAAATRTISGNLNGDLFRLDGADRVTIDGRFGGSGQYLVFANTSALGGASTFTFLNEATNNTIQYSFLRGSSTATTKGTILFSTSAAAGSLGNSNNTIEYCDIHQNAAALPTNGIYSAGTAAKLNTSNTISNNNIYNFFSASAGSSAITLAGNTTAWTISNNKFFQEATRTTTSTGLTHYVINVATGTASASNIISGNVIGGNNTSGTGTMTYTAAQNTLMAAIALNVSGVLATSSVVENNIISNLSFTSISTGTANMGVFSGIYLSGSSSVRVIGNTIGASTGTGSVLVTVNGAGSPDVNGIKSIATGTVKVENNIIGSMTATAAGSNAGMNLHAIHFTAGNLAAKNNLIGSSSTANSIQVNGTATTNGSLLTGINMVYASAYVDSVLNNTIYNLTNLNTGSSTRVMGINASAASQYIVNGNTIHNVSLASSTNVGTTSSAAVIGISMVTANTSLISLSGNKIYALGNSGSGASAWTTGIHYNGGTNTSNAVEGNFVHSLTPSTGASANVCGIQLAGGTVTNARNNMVRLGWNAVGDSITQAHNIYGIEVTSTSATNVFHNSIYIGGLVAGTGAPNSFAFRRTATSGTINIQNNIFVNERTQSSGGKHYCMYTPNTTTYTSDYNILFDPASNNNSPGLFNTTEAVSLAQWRTLTGNRDMNSSACDPAFENPTGNAANVDLHLNDLTGSAAEGRGNPVALSPAVTLDYDGETRATPALGTVDVGADAGDYIGLVGPTLAPEANGETTLTLCAGGAVVFTANASGGSTCLNWQYAWYNGSQYWNGTSFASATVLYDTAWHTINVAAISSGGNYTVSANCYADYDNCISTTQGIVTVNMNTSPATLAAAIGVPANGLNHNMQLTWASVSGVTAYEVEYSTNGSTWNALYTGTNTDYLHNTGDSPNAPYYYRVRSVFGAQSCNWTNATQYPIHTAADAPALPLLSNATPYTIDVTLQAETPVANPSATMYSIRNATTGQFVQANGSLGATEIFQTMSTWGTVTVTGLVPNTNYCFYARARNNDGDIREGAGSNIMPVEAFTTNANFATGTSVTNKFYSPASCTTGGLVYSATGGCADGMVGKSGTFTNFFGCYLRTPEVNCTGQSSVKVFFDVSHSYFAAQPNDKIRMYMWADGQYKTLACTSIKIDGVEVGFVDGTVRSLSFSQLRSCKNVEATFDLSTTTDKSNILFYIEPNNGYNNSNLFSVVLDNVSVYQGTPTACLSTAPLVLNGNYTVGTGGDYPSLTNAGGLFEAINIATLSGNVTATVISDLPAESGTHALNQWVESGAGNYTLTLRPSDNTNRLISGNYAGASAPLAGLFRINGADRFIIDGRDPSNIGAGGRHLTFRNSSVASSAFNSTFNFINDAVSDTIRYAIVEGATTGATSSNINGVVRFSTASAGGNDNITIDNCHIRDVAGALPVNAIYAAGTTGQLNSGISITNNEIYNFWGAGTNPSNGILITSGNTDWTISGNHFYQQASRAGGGTIIHFGIQIDNSTNGNNFQVLNNYIGGGQASAGGTAWTVTGTNQVGFIGISSNIMTSATSLVQGNTVANFNITSSRISAFPTNVFTGILASSNGQTTIDNNTVGSDSGIGSVTINNVTSTNATVVGIGHNTSTGDVIITNNKVGSFTINSSGSFSVTFNGIRYGQGGSSSNRTISGNLIGSLSTPNSINNNTASNNASAQDVIGIEMTGGANAVTIANNTVANLHNNRPVTGSGGQVIGINSPFATNTITGNTIYNLTTTSQETATGSAARVTGIRLSATSANGHTISQNTIYALKKSSGANAISVIGIYYGGSTGANNNVSRNLIHSLSSTGTGSVVSGIYMGAGAVTVSNNMVRLGIDEEGTTIITPIIFQGIVKDNISTNNFIYYNSVYIGGYNVGSTVHHTYAFRRTQTNANDNVRNNIFVNERSNEFTGGKHYGVHLNNSTTLTMSNNLIYTSGSGTVFGGVNTTDYTNLALWNATGFGAGSVSANPQFIAPSAGTPDLNLTVGSANPAESGAVVIAGIEDDYAATSVRTGYPQTNTYGGGTAPDMGADETDAEPVDLTAPTFAYTNISTQTTACSPVVTTVQVTINDGQSGISLSSNLPRMYFRRRVGASTTSWSFTNSVQGTFVSGTTNSSVWSFTLDYATYGITPAAADEFEYYFVAQDLATIPNVGTSQTNGSVPEHSDVATIVNPANYSFPASGSYVFGGAPLSGTITVGTGGDYTSLTRFDGLFRGIYDNGLSGDLTVQIISNTSEDGNFPLYNWTEYCGSNYRVTIVPDAATLRTLSGSLSGMGLIPIYASRVTIDGSFSGSGRYLKFENTYSSSGGSENSVFRFGSGTALASSDTLRNCEVVGNTTKTAGAVVHMHNISGLVIENNLLHGGSNWAMNIVRADGSSNIAIKNNEIYNFLGWSGGTGTRSYGILIPSGNGSNWNIIDNSIYNTGINGQNVQTGLAFNPGVSSTNNNIRKNWIGGSSAQCGTGGAVTYWGNSINPSSTEVQIKAIETNCGTVLLDSNTVTNIRVQGSDYSSFIGMHILGSTAATVTNNVFGTGTDGEPSASNPIQVAGGGLVGGFAPGYLYGIWNVSTSTTNVLYDKNDFYNLQQTGAYIGGQVFGIWHGGASPAEITNNRFKGLTTAGIEYNSFTIRLEPTTSTSGNIISSNIITTPRIGAAYVNQAASIGIYVNILGSRTVSGTISNNRINDAVNLENSGYIEGIYLNTWNGNSSSNGNWNIHNNMIYLSNPGETLIRTEIDGIDIQLNSSSTANVYYNTVWIDGFNRDNTSTLANPSTAFLNMPGPSGGYGTINLRNNIFMNTRQGGSPNSDSYHVAIWRSTASATGFSSDNNLFLYRTGHVYGRLAIWGLNAMYNLSTWQGFTGTDANTVHADWTSGASSFSGNDLNPADLFTQALGSSDLHIDLTDGQSYQFISDEGTSVSVTTDFDGDARNGSTPDIGADEFDACAGPVVTTQPSNQSICEGANAQFVVANSGLAPFTYTWQVNTGSGWNDITAGAPYSGINNDTLTITSASSTMNGYQYRVNIENACGEVDSDVATLTINEAPEITAYSPPGMVNSVCALSNTGFGVTATNATGYVWQVSTNGGGAWTTVTNVAPYSGATTASLTISNTPANLHGNLYRVIVSGTCSPADTSSNMTLNVGAVSITTQPLATTTICDGANGIIFVEATGNNLSYQWEVNTGSGWNSVTNGGVYSGATNDTLSITGAATLMNGYQYRVIVNTIACTALTSTTSTLNVPASPTASISGSTTVCLGDATTITFNGTANATVTYTINGGSNQTIVLNGSGTATLNTGALSVETTYALVGVLSGSCSSSATGSAVVSINPTANVNIAATSTTLCAGNGTQVQFTDGPAFGELAYTINGGSPLYIVLNGSGAATVNTGVLFASRTYALVSVADEFCETELTGSVTVTVAQEPEAFAGNDVNVSCAATSVNLSSATADNAVTILWTTSGDGTFNNAGIANPIYTFGAGDDVSVTLTLTITGGTGCGSANDAVTINIAQATWYADADGDGYGDPNSTPNCTGGAGYAQNNTDFCDTNAQLNPTTGWFVDFDNDGYGSYVQTTGDIGAGCNTTFNMPGVGHLVLVGNDCNDGNANVHPGATEICWNGIDDNCDGQQNEGCAAIPPPANDNPASNNPNLSSVNNVYPNCNSITGTTIGATVNAATGTRDVWYQFTAISNGVSIRVSSTQIDPAIYLYNATASAQLAVESVVTGTGTEILNFGGLVEGQSYRIAVSSANASDGTFSICAMQLRRPTCGTAGPYSLCTAFKSTNTGASTTTYSFTLGANTTSATSATTVSLGQTSLQLQYGNTYSVGLVANYVLADGNGQSETVNVPNETACSIAITDHPLLEVRSNQRCSTGALLYRTSYVMATPIGSALCGVTGYRAEFTPVSNCAGANPQIGQTFSKTITSPTASMSLSYAFNHLTPAGSYPATGYWLVRWRPRFGSAEGNYGPAHVIAVAATAPASGMLLEPGDEMNGLVNTSGIEANLYPNPNMGDMVNLNLTGITTPDVYVRIMDSMGRVVYTNRYTVEGSLNTSVNFTKPLAGGLYMVEFTTGKEVVTQRMVVAR